jgi:hypothetical protein
MGKMHKVTMICRELTNSILLVSISGNNVEYLDLQLETSQVGQVWIESHYVGCLSNPLYSCLLKIYNLLHRPPMLYIVGWNIMCTHNNICGIFSINPLIYSAVHNIYQIQCRLIWGLES